MTITVTAGELFELPLFDGCSPEDLTPILDAVTGIRRIPEGEVICREGETAGCWWIVAEGAADVTVGGIYTASIGAGETIGEMALLDGEPRTATVTAATPMTLHEVDGARFVEALLASPRLALALLREIAARLRATNQLPPPPSRAAARLAVTPVHPAAPPPRGFDPTVPGYVGNPLPYLAAAREAAAVEWSEALSSWFVTRYEDVHRLARSRSLVGSVGTLERSDAADAFPVEGRPRPGHKMMIRRDGDDHVRIRRLLAKVFTPRAISAWQQRAEEIVERLLDAAAEHDEIDVMQAFAMPLPVEVISEMLGMPQADTPQLRQWTRTLTRGLDGLSTEEEREASADAGRAISDFVRAVIADKREHPGPDILTSLLQAEEDGLLLDELEVTAQVLLLYIAGHETTLNLIGNGLTHLFRFPDQLDRLRSEPGLDANAVEEVLRFESPAQVTRRVAIEPVEIEGITVPAGDVVTLSLASANHDPRKWGLTADVLDVARPGAHEHMAFGAGSHFCLGAALARLEGKAALPRLVRRFPRMEPAYDEPDWLPRVAIRGVDTLPVRLRG